METADLSHHISRRFNEDLERVRSKVLGMGGFVEQQLHKAITALIEELGMGPELEGLRPRTVTLGGGQVHQFNSPLSLRRFRP